MGALSYIKELGSDGLSYVHSGLTSINTIGSDKNRSIDINHRNSKSRLAKLEQIKIKANKNKDSKIDDKELNDVFASLEKEIFGTSKLFSYEKVDGEYFAIYMGIKLNIPIKTPEQLISTLNLLDKLIDDNIFKAGKKEKFSARKDWGSNVFHLKNINRISNTKLIDDARLEKITGNKEGSYQGGTHFTSALEDFLNQVQNRMNSINYIDDVAQYQRKELPPVQEDKQIPGIAQIDRIQKELLKGGKIKKAKK